MSMEANYYTIAGYDLTPFRDEIYTEEWAENEENIDRWENRQRKGEIQLFSDPCSGNHLYFGYILSTNNEFDEFEPMRIPMELLLKKKPFINYDMHKTGLKIPEIEMKYSVISFCEYR